MPNLLVFVSSTFKDMQRERDILLRNVYPDIRRRLAADTPNVQLRWGDLRHGIFTDGCVEEDSERIILQTCLSNLGRKEDLDYHLVVLLGDRYGWVPQGEPKEDANHPVARALAELGHRPPPGRKSVTELEIEIGAFRREIDENRVHFFVRKADYRHVPHADRLQFDDHYAADTTGEASATENSNRLRLLLRRIEDEYPNLITEYPATLTQNGKRWTLASEEEGYFEERAREWVGNGAQSLARSKSQTQRHSSTAADRETHRLRAELCDFQGRTRLVSQLWRWWTTAHRRALVITGEAGLGKSTLLLAFVAAINKSRSITRQRIDHDAPTITKDLPCFLLVYATILGHKYGKHHLQLRWIQELEELLRITDRQPVNNNLTSSQANQRLESLFHEAARQGALLIVVDGMDEYIDLSDRTLRWLTECLPKSGRLLVSARSASEFSTHTSFLADEWESIQLESDEFTIENAASLFETASAQFCRELPTHVIERAVAKKRNDGRRCSENPLWVRVLAGELNALGELDYKAIDERSGVDPQQRWDPSHCHQSTECTC
ncbi:MAG TPA: ATP-binding protein [Rhodopirellula baltica]|uniref:Probable telomerase protein-1 n=1 Tax=Rhodopirellula baltica (strain DSM 10527 / NCIMB 13988 / SH1) TaxID=243090 RepID=Q7UEI0_RHOBA|nr:AAA family ATPase [Rhodopirellula baltica]CAD79056.1 probable telomerase protein-1 [Rhodopirellula baltica SH 1]HBE62164.1 ATP-binding protein [Rhodopirellula baltica]